MNNMADGHSSSVAGGGSAAAPSSYVVVGYPDEIFAHREQGFITCAKCGLVPRQAVSLTRCRHFFCRACIRTSMRMSPHCPVPRCGLASEPIEPDDKYFAEIARYVTRCNTVHDASCNWSGPLHEYDLHCSVIAAKEMHLTIERLTQELSAERASATRVNQTLHHEQTELEKLRPKLTQLEGDKVKWDGEKQTLLSTITQLREVNTQLRKQATMAALAPPPLPAPLPPLLPSPPSSMTSPSGGVAAVTSALMAVAASLPPSSSSSPPVNVAAPPAATPTASSEPVQPTLSPVPIASPTNASSSPSSMGSVGKVAAAFPTPPVWTPATASISPPPDSKTGSGGGLAFLSKVGSMLSCSMCRHVGARCVGMSRDRPCNRCQQEGIGAICSRNPLPPSMLAAMPSPSPPAPSATPPSSSSSVAPVAAAAPSISQSTPFSVVPPVVAPVVPTASASPPSSLSSIPSAPSSSSVNNEMNKPVTTPVAPPPSATVAATVPTPTPTPTPTLIINNDINVSDRLDQLIDDNKGNDRLSTTSIESLWVTRYGDTFVSQAKKSLRAFCMMNTSRFAIVPGHIDTTATAPDVIISKVNQAKLAASVTDDMLIKRIEDIFVSHYHTTAAGAPSAGAYDISAASLITRYQSQYHTSFPREHGIIAFCRHHINHFNVTTKGNDTMISIIPPRMTQLGVPLPLPVIAPVVNEELVTRFERVLSSCRVDGIPLGEFASRFDASAPTPQSPNWDTITRLMNISPIQLLSQYGSLIDIAHMQSTSRVRSAALTSLFASASTASRKRSVPGDEATPIDMTGDDTNDNTNGTPHGSKKIRLPPTVPVTAPVPSSSIGIGGQPPDPYRPRFNPPSATPSMAATPTPMPTSLPVKIVTSTGITVTNVNNTNSNSNTSNGNGSNGYLQSKRVANDDGSENVDDVRLLARLEALLSDSSPDGTATMLMSVLGESYIQVYGHSFPVRSFGGLRQFVARYPTKFFITGHGPGPTTIALRRPNHANQSTNNGTNASVNGANSGKSICRNYPNCKFGNKCHFLHIDANTTPVTTPIAVASVTTDPAAAATPSGGRFTITFPQRTAGHTGSDESPPPLEPDLPSSYGSNSSYPSYATNTHLPPSAASSSAHPSFYPLDASQAPATTPLLVVASNGNHREVVRTSSPSESPWSLPPLSPPRGSSHTPTSSSSSSSSFALNNNNGGFTMSNYNSSSHTNHHNNGRRSPSPRRRRSSSRGRSRSRGRDRSRSQSRGSGGGGGGQRYPLARRSSRSRDRDRSNSRHRTTAAATNRSRRSRSRSTSHGRRRSPSPRRQPYSSSSSSSSSSLRVPPPITTTRRSPISGHTGSSSHIPNYNAPSSARPIVFGQASPTTYPSSSSSSSSNGQPIAPSQQSPTSTSAAPTSSTGTGTPVAKESATATLDSFLFNLTF